MRLGAIVAGACILMGSAVGPSALCGAASGSAVGIYADADHRVCSMVIDNAPYSLTVWVFLQPGASGLQSGEMGISFPEWVQPEVVTNNPDFYGIGCPVFHLNYWCFNFNDCRFDWVWPFRVRTSVTVGGMVGQIRIVSSAQGKIVAANCQPGHLEEPMTVLTDFHVNESCAVGTEDQSWGAVKALFRQ